MNPVSRPIRNLSGFDFLVLLLALLINFSVLAHFYNRSWLPGDDGLYAHIAERVLNGEVLNAQISEYHAGYIHFVNAAAMKLFGTNLVSMRIPIAVMTWVQSLLIFLLLLKVGRAHAFTASVTSAALGFIQISSPAAHLYTLFFTVIIICWLTWTLKNQRLRLFIIGFLLATIFLFRQLTGALVGVGTLIYLLLEKQPDKNDKKHIFTKITIALMFSLILAFAYSGPVFFSRSRFK